MKYTLLLLGMHLGSLSYAQQTNASLQVGPDTRDYIYYQPAIYNPTTDTVPVLFVFHGLGDNAANMSNIGFNQIADTANMIPVYLEGFLNAFGQSAWNNGTILSSTVDDLAFVAQVLDSIQAWYNIDTNKIYATGFSMGGIMSHHLACANDEVDAITSVGGTMATSDISGCLRTNPMRVMHMHGTADGTVPYGAGPLPSLSLVPETLNFWKNYGGCQDSIGYSIANTVNDGISIDWFIYGTCNQGAELEHWRLNGADHIYPYPPVNDVFATTITWHFLENYDHGYLYGPLAVNELYKNSAISIYPNPASDEISFLADSEIEKIMIHDLNGKLKLEKSYSNLNSISVNISALTPGIYYVFVSTPEGMNTKKIVVR